MTQPATSRYIARKLWSFFAYPDPSDQVVERIAAVMRKNKFSIRETMRAILNHFVMLQLEYWMVIWRLSALEYGQSSLAEDLLLLLVYLILQLLDCLIQGQILSDGQ